MTHKIKDVTVTTTVGAYSAQDVVGGLITVPMNLFGGGYLDDIMVIDTDDVGAEFDIYVFSSAPSSIADNAAFTLSDADAKKLVAGPFLAIGSYTDVGGAKVLSVAEELTRASLSRPFPGKNLYIYLVCTATPTFISTPGVTLRVSAHTAN